MMFPFTIRYTRRLSRKLSDSETAAALHQIKTIVEKETVEDVEIENSLLTFTVSFFGPTSKWNIMVPIEKGQFNLITTDSATTLTYEFFMYRMFIITSIMATFGGIVSGRVGVGIFFFTVLLWFNWGIALIRHNGLLDDIEWEINEKLKT